MHEAMFNSQGGTGKERSGSPRIYRARWKAVCPYQYQDCGDETRRLKHTLQLLHGPHEEDGTKRQTHKPLRVEQSHRRHGSHLPRSSYDGNRNSTSVNSSCQAPDSGLLCTALVQSIKDL